MSTSADDARSTRNSGPGPDANRGPDADRGLDRDRGLGADHDLDADRGLDAGRDRDAGRGADANPGPGAYPGRADESATAQERDPFAPGGADRDPLGGERRDGREADRDRTLADDRSEAADRSEAERYDQDRNSPTPYNAQENPDVISLDEQDEAAVAGGGRDGDRRGDPRDERRGDDLGGERRDDGLRGDRGRDERRDGTVGAIGREDRGRDLGHDDRRELSAEQQRAVQGDPADRVTEHRAEGSTDRYDDASTTAVHDRGPSEGLGTTGRHAAREDDVLDTREGRPTRGEPGREELTDLDGRDAATGRGGGLPGEGDLPRDGR